MGNPTAVTVLTATKRIGTCNGANCGARIEWYKTLHDRNMPVNLNAPYLTTGQSQDGELTATISSDDVHWTTCPDSARFKRK